MILAGLQKLSLVDYPGFISSIIFTQGCNFFCGYCQNPDLIQCDPKYDCTEEYVTRFLSGHRDMIEGVVITGGEPTVHKDLPGLIGKIKELGYKIKLDTNGANPVAVEGLIRERKLDYIALDIKTSLDKYSQVTGIKDIGERIARSVYLLLLSYTDYEIRITCVPGLTGETEIVSIARMIKGAERCVLQQFRPIVTYDEKFREVKPYSREILSKFKNILSDHVKNVEIRGV